MRQISGLEAENASLKRQLKGNQLVGDVSGKGKLGEPRAVMDKWALMETRGKDKVFKNS